MSQWTHVCGCIRFDAIRGVPGQNIESLKKALGNTVSYGDPKEKWDACDVPCGSEGSLQYSIYENPSLSSIAAYTVSVHGDLRNYDSVDEIEKWLNRVTENWNKMIRQVVFHIRVEGIKETIFWWDGEKINGRIIVIGK